MPTLYMVFLFWKINDLRETLSFCAETLAPIADKNDIKFIFDFGIYFLITWHNRSHIATATNCAISIIIVVLF